MAGRFANTTAPQRTSVNKGGAIVVWLAGAWTTSVFLTGLAVPSPFNVIIAFIIQILLTKGQSPFWVSRERGFAAILCIIIDAFLNGAGMWTYIKNLGETAVWKMISEWVGSSAPPSIPVLILVTVTLALLVAAGPEVLWNQED